MHTDVIKVGIVLMTHLKKKCVLNKTKDKNVKVFNMTTRIIEEKTLLKHVSYHCKWKFNSKKYKSNKK